MPYTRAFKLDVGNFKPGNNPVYTGKCYVDTAIAGDEVFGISTANLAAAAGYSEPILVIYMGDAGNANLTIIGNYIISAVNPTSFTLTDLAGGAVMLVDGTYNYRLFDGAYPNSNDLPCEAFVLASDNTIEVILTSGQHVVYPAGTFVVGGIYQIAIAEILSVGVLPPATGYLLGTYGINGTAFIS